MSGAPAYASSTLLPYAASHRGSRQYLGSQISLPRPSLNISSPLPGVGDVPSSMPPARYNDLTTAEFSPGEMGLAVTPEDSIGKRASRQRVYDRLSVQTVQYNRLSVQTLRPMASDSSFFKDAEIAALLSDASLPPASTSPSKQSTRSITPRPSQARHEATASFDTPPPPLPEKPKNMVIRRSRKIKSVIEAPTPIVPRSELSQIGPSKQEEVKRVPSFTEESRPREQKSEVPEPRPESLLSTASWGSAASARALKALRPVERNDRTPSPQQENGDKLEDLSDSTTPQASGSNNLQTPARSAMTSAVSYTGISGLLTPQAAYQGLSPSNSYSDLSDGMRTPTYPSSGLMRTPSSIREIQSLRMRNSTLEVHNARLEFEVMKAAQRPLSSYTSRNSIDTLSDTNYNYDFAVPTLLAEIEALKRNGQRLKAELYGLKSQVSLLLPPPSEPAESEQEHEQEPAPEPESVIAEETEADLAVRDPFTPTREIPMDSPPPSAPDNDDCDTPSGTPTPRLRAADLDTATPTDLIESCPSPSSSYTHSSRSSVAPLTPDTSHEWSPLVLPAQARDSMHQKEMTAVDEVSINQKETLAIDDVDSSLDARLMTTVSGTPLTNLPPRVASKLPGARTIASASGIPRTRSQQMLRAEPVEAKARPMTVVETKSESVEKVEKVEPVTPVETSTKVVPAVVASSAPAQTPAPVQVPPTPAPATPVTPAPAKSAPASPAPPRPPRRSTLRRKVAAGEVGVAELEELKRLRMRAAADERRTPSFTAF